MPIAGYQFDVDQCDVPAARRAALREYRTFRQECLEFIRGTRETSVTAQLYDLTWHTAVFRTLNEARRLEPCRQVNGALWELTTAGYASLMALGIRRLVDKNPRTDSLWNLIAKVERRRELLTREKFICYDGLPYDFQKVHDRYVESLDMSNGGHLRWQPTAGPEAWATSQRMHCAFDRLSGSGTQRKRTDVIRPALLQRLKDSLSHSAIEKVCTMANKRIAHAERIAEGAEPAPIATYNDIDEALKQIVAVTTFLSSFFFYDAALGSVVATPQFDVLAHLDAPWTGAEQVPVLQEFWDKLCRSMDTWASDTDDRFLSSDSADPPART